MFSRFLTGVVIVSLAALAALALPLPLSRAASAQPAPHSAAPASGSGRHVAVVDIDGVIGPASADHVRGALARAHRDGAAAVVLRLDTPGGLDTSMRRIIRDIVGSPLPVLAFVAPGGARAASAGAYIVVASHVAAMAPGTNIGAATPVQLGAPGGSGTDPFGNRERSPAGASAPAGSSGPAAARTPANASEAKALNDAVAYIRSLAEMRGRNADWGERAVREAASLPASQALKDGVIDLVVDDVPALLRSTDGRTVQLAAGSVTLRTAALAQRPIEPDWRSRLLGVVTNPNLALILMMVGVYGLFFEFMNPGALVPGVIGAISLLVGLYALSTLPLSVAGTALLLLGVGLLVAEAFAPSFGVLGIGGAVAFVFGAALLVDTDLPDFGLSLPLAGGLALSGLLFSTLVLRLAARTRHQRAITGSEALLGTPARVIDWAQGRGHVHLHGERWQAQGPELLSPGQAVRVAAVQGLRVTVVDELPPGH